jgi:peroxiredoxin
MKKFILFLAIIITATLLAAQDKPTGLNLSDKAPLFSAKDQSGKTVSLKKQLKSGKVVLVFYRGQWCPYCNKQLSQLEDSLSAITGKGATVIAITPEKAENIDKTIAKTKAGFSILHDKGLVIMNAYKVAFAVDEKTIVKYKGYGIDFTEANGSNGANLPVPAVYIIEKNGTISYKYFDTDYTKRASVKDILDHL